MTDIKVTHTPGPWEWRERHPLNACAEVIAIDPDGFGHGIATLYGGSEVVSQPKPGEPWGDHPIRRANARLIAAAPDLLAALREAVEFHDDEDNETIARWRAAIAKAEGNT